MDYYLVTKDSSNKEFEYQEYRHIGTYHCNEIIKHNFFNYLPGHIIYIVPKEENPEYIIGFYKNGELQYTRNYYQMGYLDLFIDYGSIDEISVSFGENANGDYDVYVNENLADIDLLYEERLNNSLENIEVFNDKVTMVSRSNEDHHVYTSITYDEGWTLKIDGVEKEFYKVNFGFIGFDVESGCHEIEFTYNAPLCYEGIVLSAMSLVIFVIVNKKRSVGIINKSGSCDKIKK